MTPGVSPSRGRDRGRASNRWVTHCRAPPEGSSWNAAERGLPDKAAFVVGASKGRAPASCFSWQTPESRGTRSQVRARTACTRHPAPARSGTITFAPPEWASGSTAHPIPRSRGTGCGTAPPGASRYKTAHPATRFRETSSPAAVSTISCGTRRATATSGSKTAAIPRIPSGFASHRTVTRCASAPESR